MSIEFKKGVWYTDGTGRHSKCIRVAYGALMGSEHIGKKGHNISRYPEHGTWILDTYGKNLRESTQQELNELLPENHPDIKNINDIKDIINDFLKY